MAIFARAFLYCIDNDLDFEEMAKKLATIDWHILDAKRTSLKRDLSYASDVRTHADPIWQHLLVIGENRYRVSSSSVDADAAWQKICIVIFDEFNKSLAA